jgi:hypothetical protein
MSKFFTIILCLSSFLSFAQATHFKSVKIEVLTETGKTYHEVICVTFYRQKDVGFDLYSHSGNLIAKVDVRAVLPSNHPLDETIMARISSDIYKREKELYTSQETQKIVAATLLTAAKIAIPMF